MKFYALNEPVTRGRIDTLGIPIRNSRSTTDLIKKFYFKEEKSEDLYINRKRE